MTVSKLTDDVKPLDEVDKINEIIDELDNIDPLPSQTGKAGKFLQTDGTEASWESAPFRNIGEIVASTIPLTDAGLHLLDGALIQGDGIYSAFVTYIAGLVSTYPNLFVSESDWQTAVTTYGICDKFVYDSTNNTVRLPKYGTQIITKTSTLSISTASTVPVIGNGYSLGLTDGTSNFAMQLTSGGGNQDNFSTARYGSVLGTSSTGTFYSNKVVGLTTDATKSGIIAVTSGVVTANLTDYPLDCYYYIVIATSTKTDIEVDIDNVVTDLNGKADRDLSNISASANVANKGLTNLTNGLSNTICTTKPSTTSTASSTRPAVVTQNYVNGTSWYRVYSDGWCEQGGVAATDLSSITFLKSFGNTNYNAVATMHKNAAGDVIRIGTKSAGSLAIAYDAFTGGGNAGFEWRACGYIS